MITLNGVIISPCTYFVLSFLLSFLGCSHLCYLLMLSFFTVSKCYNFYVIIFPCTYFVLSFMLSFDVIIYCYHFPPFFFFLKTWHTPIGEGNCVIHTFFLAIAIFSNVVFKIENIALMQFLFPFLRQSVSSLHFSSPFPA